MGGVPDYLSIGDFSRATHMTVKTLRHYHQVGLLEPAEVDSHTGYRRYTVGQIPAAQVIRRFRDLGMPLEEIQGVLSAPDLRTRNERITAHLSRLEEELGRTQWALTSLRDLLAPPSPESEPARIELRSAPAVPAAAVTGTVAPRSRRPGCRAHSASFMRPWPPGTYPPAGLRAASTPTKCSPGTAGR
jgi:DNA-binding transcriptional MerR regulator